MNDLPTGDTETTSRRTQILSVNLSSIGQVVINDTETNLLDDWDIDWDDSSPDARSLRRAADQLRESDIPVAFPTETVYGLAADATRSDAVKGIYAAKQRPSDNPLIVHVASLHQLRTLLRPKPLPTQTDDPIPKIYKPLIEKFWPGPITILLPNPQNSVLAPEVTAGLDTFGARIPRSILALALIKLAGVPLAAPSANASTKPSPTAAEHVKHDLDGRIDYIIDGGPCDIGVESTVIDGLSHPPAILRPGGISIEQIRQVPGWGDVVIGYGDANAAEGFKPRAPGMKYRHYSPRAKVILFELSAKANVARAITPYLPGSGRIGIIRTTEWPTALGIGTTRPTNDNISREAESSGYLKLTNGITVADRATLHHADNLTESTTLTNLLRAFNQHRTPVTQHVRLAAESESHEGIEGWEVNLGADLQEIGRGLFSALRELDLKMVDVIFVEGIADDTGSVAAAIMNRLRKAAAVIVKDVV